MDRQQKRASRYIRTQPLVPNGEKQKRECPQRVCDLKAPLNFANFASLSYHDELGASMIDAVAGFQVEDIVCHKYSAGRRRRARTCDSR